MNNLPNNHYPNPARGFSSSRNLLHSMKAKADAQRSRAEKAADILTGIFGSMPFLLANILWFAVWIVINVGIIPGIEPFDPFPFSLLTMIVSLEAIGLAIIVLISQNRAEKIADLRQEVDLQLDMITEQELTKLLHMMRLMLEKQGIDVSQDEELQGMLQPTDVERLEDDLKKDIIKE